MILTTLVSSSLGAVIAYSVKKKDAFHLVDLMAQEVKKDDPEQMAMIYEKMKKAYEQRLSSDRSKSNFTVRL